MNISGNDQSEYHSLRWWLFIVGIVALLGLTGMNVYSLYQLHIRTVTSDKEAKKAELSSFTYDVRNRFYRPFWELSKLNMASLQKAIESSQKLPEQFLDIIKDTSKDSLFTDIYFAKKPPEKCTDSYNVRKFSVLQKSFLPVEEYPELICDSFDITETRMKNLLRDGYQWNNKVFFDDHRNMAVALVNLGQQKIVGYLSFVVNSDYLIDTFIKKKLESNFGSSQNSEVVVWLRDWTKSEILASSDPGTEYHRSKVFERQKFPNLFDSWHLAMSYTDEGTLSASKTSLTRNLVILGFVVILLLGTLVFIYTIAQRERQLSKRQATFLASVTHELKTPLAVMQAAGENLSDGRVTDPKRLSNYGNHIYTESVRLRKMIEKLLDVAKADAGQISAKATPQNVEKLVTEIIEQKREFLENNGFKISFEVNTTDTWIMIDQGHFNTIFNNLLDNAVKYSRDDKRIEIQLYSRSGSLCLTVQDHGIGIPKAEQKHIFDKFYRVEDSLTARTKGHGLGLSIVKHLTDLNEAEIEVESQPGTGTTFHLIFDTIRLSDGNEPENGNRNNITKKRQEVAEHA